MATHRRTGPASAASEPARRHSHGASKVGRTPLRWFGRIRSHAGTPILAPPSPSRTSQTGGSFPATRQGGRARFQTKALRGSTREAMRQRGASRTTATSVASPRSQSHGVPRKTRGDLTTARGQRHRATIRTVPTGTAFAHKHRLRSSVAAALITVDREIRDTLSPAISGSQTATTRGIIPGLRCS